VCTPGGTVTVPSKCPLASTVSDASAPLPSAGGVAPSKTFTIAPATPLPETGTVRAKETSFG
jgi:hypothetical protein